MIINIHEEKDKFEYVGKKVADHAKTEAEARNVPYTDTAKEIMQMIKKSSEEFGFYDDNNIF